LKSPILELSKSKNGEMGIFQVGGKWLLVFDLKRTAIAAETQQ